MLAEICDSNALYGYTDFDGYLEEAIPIHGVMGDSHGALYGQGCVNPGMIKATYGTGSSIMMNVGEKPIFSDKGVVTSLAWSLSGKVNYVLEGNINYTGAVITWLQKDLGLIASAKETEELAKKNYRYHTDRHPCHVHQCGRSAAEAGKRHCGRGTSGSQYPDQSDHGCRFCTGSRKRQSAGSPK